MVFYEYRKQSQFQIELAPDLKIIADSQVGMLSQKLMRKEGSVLTSTFEVENGLTGEERSSFLGSYASDSTSTRGLFPEIIGRSRTLLDVLDTVRKIARSDAPVLVVGESGTGKELVAAAVHRLSNRRNRRFVAINCSAIPESLLESEIFGHEKGAFTGAVAKRVGLLEQAYGGTLFLDEIGDMPLSLQAKLLRVLQEKEYTSVGGSRLKAADMRIIAATNVDLEAAVAAGKFRLDLFYRINVLPVTLPPLRERTSDIELLAESFLSRAKRAHGSNGECFLGEGAIEAMKMYSWPGNIRELQNVISRLVVLKAEGELRSEDLPFASKDSFLQSKLLASKPLYNSLTFDEINNRQDLASRQTLPTIAIKNRMEANNIALPEQGIQLISYINEIENQLILQALQRTNQNKNQAAKLLGLNRTTLVERIKKRGLTPKLLLIPE